MSFFSRRIKSRLNMERAVTRTMAQPTYSRFKDNQYRRLDGGIAAIAVCL
jgi:hypothetical protein